MGHPIMTGPEHAIERACGNVELVPALCGDYPLDQRVDGGIGDAGEIKRAVRLGCLGAEIAPELDARRVAHGVTLGGDVEIEIS